MVLRLLVGTWFQVLFHSPNRGTFHYSLALLLHYRSRKEYLALGGGPPRFTPDSTWPALLGKMSRGLHLSLTGLSPCIARLSRLVQLESAFVTLWDNSDRPQHIPRPRIRNARWLTRTRFRLIPVRSPLLRKSRFLSLPGVTEMFQLSPFPIRPYIFRPGWHDITRTGFPHSEICGSQFASQLPAAYRKHTTSFIGSTRQSIRHVSLSAPVPS